MTTLATDAIEQQDVDIFDVTSAFLQTVIPKNKNLIMRIRDEFVDIMYEVNPKYVPYVQHTNRKKVSYVRVLRVI